VNDEALRITWVSAVDLRILKVHVPEGGRKESRAPVVVPLFPVVVTGGWREGGIGRTDDSVDEG